VFAVRIFYTIFISALVILFALHVGLELYGAGTEGRKTRGRKGGAIMSHADLAPGR